MYSCFFDVRRAYDTVWHGRLLRKIKEVGLSGRIYNFVKAFLSKRTFQVRWKGTLSNSQRLDMGVPQGSVIAPLLFSVMLYDINKIQNTMLLLPCMLTTWPSGRNQNAENLAI